MNEETRCYTFTDFMLRPIQQGIQAGHAAMELVNKYLLVTGWQNGYAEQVSDWASNHKTMICLNGGMYGDIVKTLEFFESEDNKFPFAGFVEEANQGGNLTSVAVILPARIFDGAARLRRQKYDPQVTVTQDHLLEELRISWVENDEANTDTYSTWESDLMNRLNGFRLAQ